MMHRRNLSKSSRIGKISPKDLDTLNSRDLTASRMRSRGVGRYDLIWVYDSKPITPNVRISVGEWSESALRKRVSDARYQQLPLN